MTRKHFKLIAEIIARIADAKERRELAEHNAANFTKLNPRFNKSRFFAACNV